MRRRAEIRHSSTHGVHPLLTKLSLMDSSMVVFDCDVFCSGLTQYSGWWKSGGCSSRASGSRRALKEAFTSQIFVDLWPMNSEPAA